MNSEQNDIFPASDLVF
jgi:hypothetical protein